MNPLRILITGGAGFIGSRLASRLTRDGHTVIVFDSLVDQVHGGRTPPCDGEAIWADVRDEAILRAAMRGIDVVHHLAAETAVGQSQYAISRYVSANVLGTALVLEAAAQAGVRQVILPSSRAVYGEGAQRCPDCGFTQSGRRRSSSDLAVGLFEVPCGRCGRPAQALPMAETTPPSPCSVYGVTKVQQEELLAVVSASDRLVATVLRLFNAFGPGQSLSNPYVGVLATFFRRIRSGQPIELYEDGEMLRDFIYVDDVVEVLRRCTGNEAAYGKTWNVGSGRPVTLRQIALALCEIVGVAPQIDVTGRYRVGDIRHAIADASLLSTELGYVAPTTVENGLQAFVAWARENDDDAADDFAEQELRSRNVLRKAST